MSECIKSGRSVEEAVAAALAELGVPRDRCEVEVLEEPGRGLLGLIGSREARVRVSVRSAGKAELATGFIEQVLQHLRVEGRLEVAEEEEAVHIAIDGPDAALLIGRHGQTLEALQLLAEVAVGRRSEDRRRLVVDVEGYRERRRRAVEDMAQRAARAAERTGRAIELEPMPAYERRLVHLALQGNGRVRTESKGEDPYRRVVIWPES